MPTLKDHPSKIASLKATLFAVLLATFMAGQAEAGIMAHLVLDSPPHEFIGGGKHSDVTYTPENTKGGLFFAQILSFGDVNGKPGYLEFTLAFPNQPDEFALLDFATNKLGVPFAPGTYNNAERAAFADPGHPGLDIEFEHRGANTLTGSFTVNSVSFFTDATGATQIGSLDVNFTEYGDGEPNPLTGHFTYQGPAVPEPTSMALFGMGLASAAFLRLRRFLA